jgi:hypothetical protein
MNVYTRRVCVPYTAVYHFISFNSNVEFYGLQYYFYYIIYRI